MIKFKHKGDFSKTKKFFKKMKQINALDYLDSYGRKGVQALSSMTPVDSGLTASSWYYEIVRNSDSVSLVWSNSNRNDGVLIAVLLQYGHATGNGGYVVGKDYINPAIRPIFDKIAQDLGREIRDA